MDWLINLIPIVGLSIFLIVVMRIIVSMSEQDGKRNEEPLSSMGPLIGVGVIIIMVIAATVLQSGVGANYNSFGEVNIAGKGSIFSSFSYVILTIGVLGAIYLFRKELFRRLSLG